MRTMQMTEIRL